MASNTGHDGEERVATCSNTENVRNKQSSAQAPPPPHVNHAKLNLVDQNKGYIIL